MPPTNKGTLLAEGIYTHHRGDAPTGHETWQLTKLAHGGMVFTSRIEMTSPKPATLNFTFEITQNWAPVRLSLRRDAEGKTLTSEQRATGAQWQARIEPRGGTAQDLALDFGVKHAVAFASPVLVTAMLFRLNLQVGQSREVDAIVVDPVTLVPQAVKQTYACLAEETIEVPAGKFAAWHYRVDAGGENHLWAERNGIVLSHQTANGDAAKLARYRRIERR